MRRVSEDCRVDSHVNGNCSVSAHRVAYVDELETEVAQERFQDDTCAFGRDVLHEIGVRLQLTLPKAYDAPTFLRYADRAVTHWATHNVHPVLRHHDAERQLAAMITRLAEEYYPIGVDEVDTLVQSTWYV